MDNSFQRVNTGSAWEERYGYSRAIRVARQVFVTGTTALNPDGSTHVPGNLGAQTTRCFEIIEAALKELGADRTAIVRSRAYLTDITQVEAMGEAHRQFFGQHRPCLTAVEVSRLIRDDMVVEIECDAVLTLPA